MAKGEKAQCPECPREVAVGAEGMLRRHPKGAPDPCPGSGFVVRAPEGKNERATRAIVPRPSTAQATVGKILAPGVYATHEKMLDGATPIPAGHVAVSITALVPFDGSNGRTPREEAELLFGDSHYLDKVLSEVPNRHFRLLLKVPAADR